MTDGTKIRAWFTRLAGWLLTLAVFAAVSGGMFTLVNGVDRTLARAEQATSMESCQHAVHFIDPDGLSGIIRTLDIRSVMPHKGGHVILLPHDVAVEVGKEDEEIAGRIAEAMVSCGIKISMAPEYHAD